MSVPAMNERMRRRRLIATAPAALTLAAVAGCSDDPTEEFPEPPARVVESELIREDAGTPDETVAVEGRIERTRDESISYLEVRAAFYDADAELLDSTIEQVENVQAGGDSWPFRVVYPHHGEPAADVVDHDASVVRNP